jgi:hypothetical protein
VEHRLGSRLWADQDHWLSGMVILSRQICGIVKWIHRDAGF